PRPHQAPPFHSLPDTSIPLHRGRPNPPGPRHPITTHGGRPFTFIPPFNRRDTILRNCMAVWPRRAHRHLARFPPVFAPSYTHTAGIHRRNRIRFSPREDRRPRKQLSRSQAKGETRAEGA